LPHGFDLLSQNGRRGLCGFFAGFLLFAVCEGCGSSSFGVSANAAPDIRNSDKIIAAVFLIASLFYCSLSMKIPVSLQTFAQVNVEGASYWHVNRM